MSKALDEMKYRFDRLNKLICSPVQKELKKKHLTPENTAKILALKNKYQGKRCFIIGGSPSLNQLDLAKLNNERTFTINRGYMLSRQGLNHSDFHVLISQRLFYDNKVYEEIPPGWADIFFFNAVFDSLPFSNIIYLDFDIRKYWQPDLTKTQGNSFTSASAAALIAAYSGFKDIYLIGVDLDFTNLSGHAYSQTDGEKERQTSHSGVSAPTMLEELNILNKRLGENGINLYNASPAGIVNCLPRVKYEELFI